MGKLINANKEEFQQILDTEKNIVLVDFWAEWCGPCRMLGPELELVSEEVEDVTIVKVNVDENSELSAEYGVRNIPVVFVIKDGEQIDKFVGLKKKDKIVEIIDKNRTTESEDTEDTEVTDPNVKRYVGIVKAIQKDARGKFQYYCYKCCTQFRCKYIDNMLILLLENESNLYVVVGCA